MLSLVGKTKSQSEKINNTVVSPKSEDLTSSKKIVNAENAAKRKAIEEERERERKKKMEDEQKIKQAKIDEIKKRNEEEKSQLERGASQHALDQIRQAKQEADTAAPVEPNRLLKIQELENERAVHSAKSEEPAISKHSDSNVQIGESDEEILKREEERLNRALKKKEMSIFEQKRIGKK